MKTNPATFALLICLAFLQACGKERTEPDPVRDFFRLDAFLRAKEFDYDSLKIYLAGIGGGFDHAEVREISYDAWKTSVTYKWNSDSSLVFIYAIKNYPVGFRREVIIHSGDSALFIR